MWAAQHKRVFCSCRPTLFLLVRADMDGGAPTYTADKES